MKPWILKLLLPMLLTSLLGFGAWTVKAISANATETAVQKQRVDDLKGDVRYIRDKVDQLNDKIDNLKHK